jgi:hypothetical protein
MESFTEIFMYVCVHLAAAAGTVIVLAMATMMVKLLIEGWKER